MSSGSVDLGSTFGSGGGGGGVTSLNGLTGGVTLVPGSNVTITPSGSSLIISSTGGGGGSPGGVSGDIQYNASGSFGGDPDFTTDGAGNLSATSLSLTPLSAGSVLFAGAAGLISQDNSNFFWDETNTGLGLGTPTASFSLSGTTTACRLIIDDVNLTHETQLVMVEHSDTSNIASPIQVYARSRGTQSAPTVVHTSDFIGFKIFAGYDGVSSYQPMAYIIGVITDPAPSPSAMGGSLVFFTSPNGSNSPTQAMTIDNTQSVSISGTVSGSNLTVAGHAIADLAITNNLSDVASKTTSFNNLSPMTTAGDIIYENATPAGTRLAIGTTGQLLTVVGGLPAWATAATNGTVTSVALSTPGVLYSVSGSPITSSGTLALNLITQTANTILAGPASGVAANPSFRALVSADIPNNAANTTGTASNITATVNSTLTSLPSLSNVGIITGGTWQSTDIGVIYGGTGLSTIPSNGQLLIGNATGYTVANLTAGSGIGIVNASGSITISNTAPFFSVVTISSNTAAVASTTYLANTSGASFTLTLPAPFSGAFVAIKDSTGSFQTNPLTVAPHAAESIEGLAASKILQTNWGAWSIFSDGTNWYMGPF